jgi:hypothetical protein
MAKAQGAKTYNYNNTIREHLARHGKVTGEVGIEIECEGSKLPSLNYLEKYWITHADGSLRGESIEYVMAGPVPRKEVIPALEYLDGLFKEHKTKIKDSYRTSVHVHVNMQTVTIRQTYNMVLMYGILEDILTDYAGTTRVGNLFCLRMSDAEFMLDQLRHGASTDRYEHLNTNGLRYAGCNVKSLFDHNSLEFRAFRGTTDMKLIAEWVDIILQIKDSALTYANPAEMLQNFSNIGPDGFLQKNFNKSLISIIKASPKWEDRIMSGVRLVQDVAYANDWAAMPEKKDGAEKEPAKMAYYGVQGMADPVQLPDDMVPRWGDPAQQAHQNAMDRLLGIQRQNAPVNLVAPAPRPARARRVLHNLDPVEVAIDHIDWPAAGAEEL